MPFPTRPCPAWARLVALPTLAALAFLGSGCGALPGLEAIRFDERVEVLPSPTTRVPQDEGWRGIAETIAVVETRHPQQPRYFPRLEIPLDELRGEIGSAQPAGPRNWNLPLRRPGGAAGATTSDLIAYVSPAARLYLLRVGEGVLAEGGRTVPPTLPILFLQDRRPRPQSYVVLAHGVALCWRPWSGGGGLLRVAPGPVRSDAVCNGILRSEDRANNAWAGFAEVHAPVVGSDGLIADRAGYSIMTAGWAFPDRAGAEAMATRLLSAIPALAPADQAAVRAFR